MPYIEGFVTPVPAKNRAAYEKVAKEAVVLFKKLGATRVVECWGDDVRAGETTDFARAVKAQPDEVVVFSWVEYPSKEVRDAANEQMKYDAASMGEAMPFDAKRMIFGGFSVIVDD